MTAPSLVSGAALAAMGKFAVMVKRGSGAMPHLFSVNSGTVRSTYWPSSATSIRPSSSRSASDNAIAGYDVAVFSVHAPEGKSPFKSSLAIDVGAPRKGDGVAILAHSLSLRPELPAPGQLAAGAIERGLELRVGSVTDVVQGPAGLPGQSFVFRTTIPVTGGMSGAPVIVDNGGSPVVAALGVVSSDASHPDAFTSFTTPGRSTASLLWPAMGLGVQIGELSGAVRTALLGELFQRGILDNRSDRVSVHVRQVTDQTEVLYIDQRVDPPVRGLLKMTGHPELARQLAPKGTMD